MRAVPMLDRAGTSQLQADLLLAKAGGTLIAMGGSSCIYLEMRNNSQAGGLKIKTDIVEVYPRTSDSFLFFFFKKFSGVFALDNRC